MLESETFIDKPYQQAREEVEKPRTYRKNSCMDFFEDEPET